VVQHRLPAVEQDLGVEKFHGELQLRQQLPGVLEERLAARLHARGQFDIARSSEAQDLADELAFKEAGVLLGRRAHDNAKFLAAVAADHHPVAAPAGQRFFGVKRPEVAGTTVIQQVVAHLHESDSLKSADPAYSKPRYSRM